MYLGPVSVFGQTDADLVIQHTRRELELLLPLAGTTPTATSTRSYGGSVCDTAEKYGLLLPPVGDLHVRPRRQAW